MATVVYKKKKDFSIDNILNIKEKKLNTNSSSICGSSAPTNFHQNSIKQIYGNYWDVGQEANYQGFDSARIYGLASKGDVDLFSDYSGLLMKRRQRILFTQSQITELEKNFVKKNYLTSYEREKLARSVKLTTTQVKIWFQNRRYKCKKSVTPTTETSCPRNTKDKTYPDIKVDKDDIKSGPKMASFMESGDKSFACSHLEKVNNNNDNHVRCHKRSKYESTSKRHHKMKGEPKLSIASKGDDEWESTEPNEEVKDANTNSNNILGCFSYPVDVLANMLLHSHHQQQQQQQYQQNHHPPYSSSTTNYYNNNNQYPISLLPSWYFANLHTRSM